MLKKYVSVSVSQIGARQSLAIAKLISFGKIFNVTPRELRYFFLGNIYLLCTCTVPLKRE